MKSTLELIYVNRSQSFKSTFFKSGTPKTIIINDSEEEDEIVDSNDKVFPTPRLCLLRKWPSYEHGFGFNLFIDFLYSKESLKVKTVLKKSPAEAGGLKVNDVIVEVNGKFVDDLTFLHLIEIFKHALTRPIIELLVLSENDDIWYKERDIKVNKNFPNIQYCETPFYGFKFSHENVNHKEEVSKRKIFKHNLSKSFKNEIHMNSEHPIPHKNESPKDDLSFNLSFTNKNKLPHKDLIENPSEINKPDLLLQNDDNKNKYLDNESNKLLNNQQNADLFTHNKINDDASKEKSDTSDKQSNNNLFTALIPNTVLDISKVNQNFVPTVNIPPTIKHDNNQSTNLLNIDTSITEPKIPSFNKNMAHITEGQPLETPIDASISKPYIPLHVNKTHEEKPTTINHKIEIASISGFDVHSPHSNFAHKPAIPHRLDEAPLILPIFEPSIASKEANENETQKIESTAINQSNKVPISESVSLSLQENNTHKIEVIDDSQVMKDSTVITNQTRICNIIQRPGYKGLGFSLGQNLHPPHEISVVSPNSPAEISGIEKGDLLIKLNDKPVDKESYENVISVIKECITEKTEIKLEIMRQNNSPTEISILKKKNFLNNFL